MNEILMELLEENEAIVFENPSYKDAIVGISSDGGAVYDYEKMVSSLCEEDQITPEDAEDFISYNTIRSLPYMGPKAPIIITLYDFEVPM